MSRAGTIVLGISWLVAAGVALTLAARGVGPSVPRAYLAAWLVLVSLPLGALPVLMGFEVAGVRDNVVSAALRLLLASLPILALLVVPVLLDLAATYPWVKAPTTKGLAATWFSTDFFVARTIVYLVVWTVLSLFFVRPTPLGSHRRLASFGLLAHLVIGTLAAMDWFMALDPAFVSSAYGILVIAAQAAFALTTAALIAMLAAPRSRLDRAIALLVLALVAMAAFVQFTHYLVVWSANLPREIAWYQTRARDALGPAFAIAAPILVLGGFVVLLPEPFGRRRYLALGAVVALCIVEIVDLLCLASPGGTFTFPSLALDMPFLLGLAGLGALCARFVAGRHRVEHG